MQRAGRIPRTAVAPARASAYDAADTATTYSSPQPPAADRKLSFGMKPQRFDTQFASIVDLAAKLCAHTEANSLLVMLEGPTDWDQLREHARDLQIVIAADTAEELEGASEAGLA